MPIFDELGKKISSAGQNTVKAVSGLSQASSIKSRIAEEEGKVRAAYIEIGQAHYNQYADMVDAPFSDIIGRIRAGLARIAECEQELMVLQNKKACPNCGAPTTADSAFCAKCGAAFPQIAPPVQILPSAFCVSCGAPLTPGAGFCTSCGQAVTAPVVMQEIAAPAALQMAEAEQPMDAPAEPPDETAVEPSAPVCPGCGDFLVEDAVFCTSCGLRIGEDS